MKKLVLASLGALLALSMTGCSSNPGSQSIKNLNAQLERVDNTIVSSVSDDTSEISNSVPINNSTNNLQYLKNKAYNDMLEERYLKDQILSLSSYLKSNQNTKYKLAKSDVNALKSLTSDLSKYTTYLNESKVNVKSYVKKIKNQNRTDTEHVASSYQSLSNIMNERKAYLSNLLNTMNEIANILSDNNVTNSQNKTTTNENLNLDNLNASNNVDNTYNKYNNQNYIPKNNTYTEYVDYDINEQQPYNQYEKENSKQNNTKKGLIKNIDTYNNSALNTDESNIKDNKIVNNQAVNENQYYRPINNRNPYYYNDYYNAPYSNPYYNGYNYFYNPNYRYNRQAFNPGRNTDTYYPLNRNIDTYRLNPNQYALNASNLNETNNESGNNKSTDVQNAQQKDSNMSGIDLNSQTEKTTRDDNSKIKHVIRKIKQKTAKNDNESINDRGSNQQNNEVNANISQKYNLNTAKEKTQNNIKKNYKEVKDNLIDPVEKMQKEAKIEKHNLNDSNPNNNTKNNPIKQKTSPINIENSANIAYFLNIDTNKKLNNNNQPAKEKIGIAKEVKFT